jgi:hypothetical protein
MNHVINDVVFGLWLKKMAFMLIFNSMEFQASI